MSVYKIGVLFSGGVESTCLLYHYLKGGYIVYPIYVRCGFSWERFELENAQSLWHITKKRYKNLMPLAVVSLHRKRLRLKGLFIPLRNATLVLACANLL
ncbi:MAG: queuosine biosynthesis protein, partial [Aquificota bacterium]